MSFYADTARVRLYVTHQRLSYIVPCYGFVPSSVTVLARNAP